LRELIQKYLLQYHSVSIEGWGSMSLVNQPAVLDFPNRQIQSLSISIAFNEQSANSHAFISWLADELKIRPDEALQKVQAFVQWFSNTIHHNDVSWNGWGKFSKSGSQISFKAEQAMVLPKPVLAERVIRKGAEHQVRVGEEEKTSTEMEEWLHTPSAKKKHLWQLIALLISAAGIILAVLFSSKHNIQWRNYTNYQQLQPKDPPVLYKTP
jgi:nucleoid DNA-binding protein